MIANPDEIFISIEIKAGALYIWRLNISKMRMPGYSIYVNSNWKAKKNYTEEFWIYNKFSLTVSVLTFEFKNKKYI